MKFFKNKYFNYIGFTLAEVLITLVVLGVISAITVQIITANVYERQTVSKVQKMFSTISVLVYQFQTENGCTQKIADCFLSGESYMNDKFYKRLAEKLNVVSSVYPKQSLDDAGWLPKNCTHLKGDACKDPWMGVWNSGAKSTEAAYFGLADGSILSMTMPDDYMQSGFMFFDTNGSKAPNRIGKDQFPIGIGAYNNEKFAYNVHPYYNNNSRGTFAGLCNISNNNPCNPDDCTQNSCSPTAYILKHNKLPKINW